MCKYCITDEIGDFVGENLVDFVDGKLDGSVKIFPEQKMITFNVDLGSETVTRTQRVIHYCPMCGRKL